MTEEEKWFPFVPEDYLTKEKVIFCFCHAGGSALAFKKWIELKSDVAVIPVELPGRGSRIYEPYLKNYKELVNKVCIAILSKARSKKIYLFGHSMGAIGAFEAADKLNKQYGIPIEKVYVAGRQAPQDADPSPYRAGMGIEALVEELKRVGETPDQVLSDPQFQQVILPIIHQDYALHDSYQYDGKKLEIPLEAHCGTKDWEAGKDVMLHWKMATSSSFVLKEYQGGHFFVHNEDYIKELLESIQKE